MRRSAWRRVSTGPMAFPSVRPYWMWAFEGSRSDRLPTPYGTEGYWLCAADGP
jgi:hypothetical protein